MSLSAVLLAVATIIGYKRILNGYKRIELDPFVG